MTDTDETPVKLEAHLFVGAYAEDLSDGRMVRPGDAPVDIDPTDPHHAAMIERGTLIPYIGKKPERVEQEEDTPSSPEPKDTTTDEPTDKSSRGGNRNKNRTTSQEEQR